MTKFYVFALLATASVILSVFNFASFVREKQRAYDEGVRLRCVADCESVRDRDLAALQLNEAQANLQHNQALLACHINNIGNQTAREECEADEERRFREALDVIDARRGVITGAFERCADACGATTSGTPSTPDYEPPFEVPCIESAGFACYGDVADICKHISGVCGDCFTSLCPDSTWEFSSDTPMFVNLVAAAKPSPDGRTLATSAFSSTRVSLFVPRDIKLQAGEKLWLRFDFTDKPADKDRKITVRRSAG